MNWKADKLNRKADSIRAKSKLVESKIAKNQKMRELFSNGLDEINYELVTKGQDFLYMRSNGIPYTRADIDDV